MIEIAVALVFIALIAGFLVNKYLQMQMLENDRKHQLNTSVFNEKLNQELKTRLERLESLRQEFETLKLSVGLRNGR